MAKYVKSNIVNFNENQHKRVYFLPKLIYQLTVKVYIYI